MKQRMCLAQLGLHGDLAVAPRVEGKEGWAEEAREEGNNNRRERKMERRKEREEREEKSWERWTNGQTDSPDRQAPKFPPNPSTQHPRAQLMAPRLSFEMLRWASEGWSCGSCLALPCHSLRASTPTLSECISLPLQTRGCF